MLLLLLWYKVSSRVLCVSSSIVLMGSVMKYYKGIYFYWFCSIVVFLIFLCSWVYKKIGKFYRFIAGLVSSFFSNVWGK